MRTLATLGPLGSDSENAAQLLLPQLPEPCTIVLVDSFTAAFQHAISCNGYALIPAAYQEKDVHGRTQASWADAHFRIEAQGDLELWMACVLPLKAFALAKQRGVADVRTVALHAATQFYASTFVPRALPTYHPSKPAAVLACARGQSDACVGSIDVVQLYPELEIMHTFTARMCWTLYRKPLSTTKMMQQPQQPHQPHQTHQLHPLSQPTTDLEQR